MNSADQSERGAQIPTGALEVPPPVKRREVFGWCMYDFADSAFTTVIVTTLYALYFVGPGMATLGFVLYILANVGFTGGGIFIDSFLPGISNERNAGRISGMKWGLGYLGGLLALVVCGGLATSIVRDPTAEQVDRARWIPVIISPVGTVWR